MKITAHTARQMQVRGIARAWVEAAVNAPERIEMDPIPGRTRYYRAIAGFGGRVLRVVTEGQGAGLVVVTVHFDRRATKERRR
jgi:hypothetical protein